MPGDKQISVEIKLGSLIKAIMFGLLLWGIYLIRDMAAVVLFSVVIASGVDPMADWFSKRKIPRLLSVIFIYIIAFAVIGVVFYLVIPTFVGELSLFAEKVPVYLSAPTSLSVLVPGLPETISSVLVSALQDIKIQILGLTGGFLKTAADIFGGVMSFILVVVLSFYLAVQKGGLENFLKIIIPARYEVYTLDLWKRTQKKIGLWLQGQIVLALIVGVLVFLGLTILRVEYALSLALLAALLEVIPIFGPVIASIPAIAIALLQSPALAIAVVVLYVIIQQFENHLIYPLVVRKIIGVPPILAILALIIGGTVGGFFGLLLAVPVATVLKEFLDDLAAKKHIEFT